MNKTTQVPMPRVGFECELKGHYPCSNSKTLELIWPRYCIYAEQVRRCISGLTVYAAQQAAAHQNVQFPLLRDAIDEMACYWDIDRYLDKTSDEIKKRMHDSFDQVVSEARQSGLAPEFTDQAKQDILTGLEVHTQELANDDGLDSLIQHSDWLAQQLRTEWQMELTAEQQNVLTITMGGMG